VGKKRVVLAYSGGLDTSVAVRWMTDNLGVEVIAVAIDVGQGVDEEALLRRANSAGAVDAVVVDARAEFASEFIASAVRANALYEGKYPLVSALSRPVIARHLVEQARLHGASAVAHGATGKGNDQVRFEVSVMALAPDLEIMAPVRDWTLTRDDSIAYAHEHGIEVQATKENPYSIDANLWGRAIECGVLEDPWQSPPEDVFELTRPRATSGQEIIIGFNEGIPIALNGQEMPLEQLISEIGSITGSYGFGRLDMVENRRVGIKSREVYECPGSLALILAHADLESLTLERDVAHEKARMEPRWAELVYDGLWYSPLREAYDAFIASTQRYVTGEVRLRCELGGRCYVSGRRSPYSLYDFNLATYEAADSFHHKDAEGFVRIWGLGIATWSRRQGSQASSQGQGERASR